MPHDHYQQQSALIDPDTRYQAALSLVRSIDRHLERGTRHYYDAQGRLLVSLDEVVRAFLAGELVIYHPLPVDWSTVTVGVHRCSL